MRTPRLILALAAIASCLTASASFARTSCPSHFVEGTAPSLPPKLTPRTRELCYASFALLHSALSRTALWSAERLTRKSVSAAEALERSSEFFPEPRLPKTERSELSDFKYSGFDRGHLAPSGNMPTQRAQQQSFTLANIIAQHANLNRRAWRSIESDIRDAATTYGSAYVITGPLFIGSRIQSLHGRVLIPTHVWKAVYIPHQGAVVYVATNAAKPQIRKISVSQFAKSYGINPFPALTGSVRSQLLNLS